MKLKDDNFQILIDKYGFIQSKVANYPKKLVKVVDVDKGYVVEICNEKERSFNICTKEDWKGVGIFKLWECNKLDSNYKWKDGEVSPYYEGKVTHNELLSEYIADLIKDGIAII